MPRPRKPGPPKSRSGPSRTQAQRAAATGRCVVSVTLDAATRLLLAEQADARGCSRSAVVALALARLPMPEQPGE
jgi:hypothetical protein